jgi:hypothetical protein
MNLADFKSKRFYGRLICRTLARPVLVCLVAGLLQIVNCCADTIRGAYFMQVRIPAPAPETSHEERAITGRTETMSSGVNYEDPIVRTASFLFLYPPTDF